MSRVEETESGEMQAATYAFTPMGVKDAEGHTVCNTLYIAIFQWLMAAASIVLIFMYKNRVRQAKGCLLAVFAGFLLLALMLFLCPDKIIPGSSGMPQHMECVFSMWTLVTILPILLIYAANKFILKDEKLVRAADRLR